jgi:hypothetical protein
MYTGNMMNNMDETYLKESKSFSIENWRIQR